MQKSDSNPSEMENYADAKTVAHGYGGIQRRIADKFHLASGLDLAAERVDWTLGSAESVARAVLNCE